MNAPSTNSTNVETTLGSSEDSPCSAARGVRTDLKETSLTDVQKLTYEKIFYRVRSLNGGGAAQYTDSRWSRECGATATSNGVSCRNHRLCDTVEPVLHRGTQEVSYYGFPISVHRGNWCTQLKTRVFQQRPVTRRGYKYRTVFRHSCRRTRAHCKAHQTRNNPAAGRSGLG